MATRKANKKTPRKRTPKKPPKKPPITHPLQKTQTQAPRIEVKIGGESYFCIQQEWPIWMQVEIASLAMTSEELADMIKRFNMTLVAYTSAIGNGMIELAKNGQVSGDWLDQ